MKRIIPNFLQTNGFMFLVFLMCFSFAGIQEAICQGTETEIPRGGKVIDLGVGSSARSFTFKNKTGRQAFDLYACIYKEDGSTVPFIEKMNKPFDDDDKVDHNGNGILEEDENSNDVADHEHCGRLIFNGDYTDIIVDGDWVNIDIEFSGPTTFGTKLKVYFSTKHEDDDGVWRHFDLSAASSIDEINTPVQTNIPRGTHLASIAIANNTGEPIPAVNITGPEDNPFVSVLLDPSKEASGINHVDQKVYVYFVPVLAVGETVEFFLEMSAPSPDDTSTPITWLSTEPIPTLSQWGIFIFALLLLAFGVVYIRIQQNKLSLAGRKAIRSEFSGHPIFNKEIQGGTLKIFPAILVTGILVVWAIWGAILAADLFGILFSALIIAFLIQILIKNS